LKRQREEADKENVEVDKAYITHKDNNDEVENRAETETLGFSGIYTISNKLAATPLSS
jgi:hypothetical protein